MIISDDEYNRRFAEQKGVCKICGRPPKKNKLSADHDHFFDRVKITVYKDCDFYIVGAQPYVMPLGYDDKKEGRREVRKKLRKMSIRGLLCMRCNKGIAMFEDSKAPLKPAERFDAAAKYFREFEDGFRNRSAH
jgi:Recombination endonuclease VII